MHLKSILNHVEPLKSLVYERERLVITAGGSTEIEVDIEAIGVDEVQWRSSHTYLTLVSQIDTVKRLLWVAEEREEKSLRRHRHLILNWFWAKGTISSGVVEGLNGVVKLTTRKTFSFRTAKAIEITLFHGLGGFRSRNQHPDSAEEAKKISSANGQPPRETTL